jgi:hypothetical protein
MTSAIFETQFRVSFVENDDRNADDSVQMRAWAEKYFRSSRGAPSTSRAIDASAKELRQTSANEFFLKKTANTTPCI